MNSYCLMSALFCFVWFMVGFLAAEKRNSLVRNSWLWNLDFLFCFLHSQIDPVWYNTTMKEQLRISAKKFSTFIIYFLFSFLHLGEIKIPHFSSFSPFWWRFLTCWFSSFVRGDSWSVVFPRR